jgi:NAD-dependent SIR2 family protein deacetylase
VNAIAQSLPGAAAEGLAEWCRMQEHLVVLSGAGCSTASGIPDYRDREGGWKRRPPVQVRAFLDSHKVRQRYWARSLAGWPQFAAAEPNGAHLALARLEAAGRVTHVITQNVDGLHQRAGSRAVIDLHGRLDTVHCLDCGNEIPRSDMQTELASRNTAWIALPALSAPDGDADLEGVDFSAFEVPACGRCGGVLKPAVVFFGEAIPAERSRAALAQVQQAGALLVVGSSLMVWSGFRLVRAAAEAGLPVGAVNLGHTRADALLQFKLEAPCAETLARTAALLGL